MNIFRREMKAHRIGLLFWSLGMALMVMSGMAKYGAYKQAGQSATELLKGLPKTVQVILGMTGFDLSKASGFYGVLFLYLAVMAAIHAVLLGSNVIAEEERDRTSEFLYAKPVSRPRVLTGKLLAGLVNIIVLNAVTVVTSFYFVGYYGKGEQLGNEIWTLMAGLLFIQLIFFALGAAVAGTARNAKRASGRATTIMLLAFLLYYLVNLNEHLSFLRYFTPFKYYDAAALLNNGFDPVFIALSVVIIAFAVFGTYYFYTERDLSV